MQDHYGTARLPIFGDIQQEHGKTHFERFHAAFQVKGGNRRAAGARPPASEGGRGSHGRIDRIASLESSPNKVFLACPLPSREALELTKTLLDVVLTFGLSSSLCSDVRMERTTGVVKLLDIWTR